MTYYQPKKGIGGKPATEIRATNCTNSANGPPAIIANRQLRELGAAHSRNSCNSRLGPYFPPNAFQ
ncbi:MAG: hypothetical protein DMG12_00650 [Acidobacteria bacterium]|nr:MAG: hypothetical protein DMG12_00650 [Acidobacteriota bacterium]